ncbi:MAG: hypothetical protein AB7Q29_14660 [Vicinamibacterales bacterium]
MYGERSDLLEVKREVSGIRLHGYVAALAEQGPTRGPQNVFVNRRIVKDRTIAHAILDAYSVGSMKERSPEVHLFLEMPPDSVDVNVHPTKAEVRFREQSFVHEVVRRALLDALGSGGVPQLQLRSEDAGAGAVPAALPGILAGGHFPNRWVPGAAAPGTSAPALPPSFDASPPEGALPGHPGQGRVPSGPGETRPMIPLGQFRDTFIVAIDDEGIAIIDQHVAHERVLFERVLFERVMQALASGSLASQRLLVPLLIELPAGGAHAVAARTAQLEQLGYEVELFGETTLKVSAVPALLGNEAAAAALRALSEDLEGLDTGADVQLALQRIAATTACHAAVKANYPLTYDKMTHILEELRATSYSTVCPHGRPVMLRITRREIEKNFERV